MTSTQSSPLRSFSPSCRRLAARSDLSQLLVPFLAVMLVVRVLTDDLSSPSSHQSGSLNLSGGIAVSFILVAIGLCYRRRCGVLPAALAAVWLCVWTVVAISTRGASTETLREGVREGSVIALAVIVYNARGAVTVSIATRLVQLIGFVPALIAIYQLATHTGMDVANVIRANGTFAHPDSAAMFFAVAAAASLWLYLDDGRRRSDALLTAVFALALIATLSLDGLATLAAMLIAYGALRPGALRAKLAPCLVAGLVLVAFLATPLGAQRITKESSSSFADAESGEAHTSLDWRIHKWETLIAEWEAAPIFGQGLGTTVTTESIPGNKYAGEPPHNEYLRYLVETGVVGLIILLGALAVLIRSLVRRRRISSTGKTDALNASTLALVILVGCLVNSLGDNAILDSPTCYAAALILAAVLALPGARESIGAQRQTPTVPQRA